MGTQDVVYMREGEIVEVKRNGYNLYDMVEVVRRMAECISPRAVRRRSIIPSFA